MTEKCKACSSCGYPMQKASDFPLGDSNVQYCIYCTDDKGNLLPYEIILERNTLYYQKSQGIDHKAAEKMAIEILSSLPAWRNK